MSDEEEFDQFQRRSTDDKTYPLRIFHDTANETNQQELSVERRYHADREARGRGSSRRGDGRGSREGRGRRLLGFGRDSNRKQEEGDAFHNDRRGSGGGRGRGRGRGGRGSNVRGGFRFEGQYDPEGVNIKGNERYDTVLAAELDGGYSVGDGHVTNEPIQQRSEKRKFVLGYKRLAELVELDDPDDVLLSVANSTSGFKECLSSDPLKPDWLFLALKIMVLAFSSKKRQKILDLVQIIHASNFLEKISTFLFELSQGVSSVRKYSTDIGKRQEVLSAIPAVLKVVAKSSPSSLPKCHMLILSLAQFECGTPGLSDELNELRILVQTVQMEQEEIKVAHRGPGKGSAKKNSDDSPPPDNFRELSILPELKDLQWNEKPFLRANKAEGKYSDLNHYLDVQFRLLREDYIQPLRKGIHEYRHDALGGRPNQRLQDLRLYHNVQILRPVCSSSGIMYVLKFDTKPLQRVNWSASRRLLYGSLVALSQDDFETMTFATVTERNVTLLAQGQIQVRFEKDLDQIFNTSPNEMFLMAETTAYFEAYRHILKGLQEIDESMPLQKYIVRCETNISPPKYLLNKGVVPTFNFKSLVGSHCPRYEEHAIVPVLSTTRWPTADELKLDTSQYEALRTAITKELSIIQGPPGTGKTYVGLKIAKLLLFNKPQWSDEERHGNPLLVVCYTNHALDQFLEGMLKFCGDGIVRVGGRCNNDALKPFILNTLKIERRKEKNLSRAVYQGEIDCRRELRSLREDIEVVSAKLNATSMGLLSLQRLEPFMTDAQMDSLQKVPSHIKAEGVSELALWVGLYQDKDEIKNIDGNISAADIERINQSWKKLILENDLDVDSETTASIIDVWNLDLVDRVLLYKSWIKQCKDYMVTRQKLTGIVETSILKLAGTRILSATLLKPYVNKNSRRQLSVLIDQNQGSTGNEMSDWLYLDANTENIEKISNAIDALSTLSNEELADPVEDLEEDRQLLEDDNDGTDEVFTDKKERKTRDDLLRTALKDVLVKVETPANENGNDGVQGWTVKVDKEKMNKRLQRILGRTTCMDDVAANSTTNVWALPLEKRQELYRFWLQQYRNSLKEQVRAKEKEYSECTVKYQEVLDQESYDVLKHAKVIGMTTTGAAKYRHLLQKVKSKIIIVEEAAEVLEAHIITTLNSNSQHLILIGDHKQLRPTPAVYALAVKYNLDISLFERMVRNGVHCVTLEEQHRMRPDISLLMRHIYPGLRDHPRVLSYDKVSGFDGNVHFIDHKEEEEHQNESRSYTNLHEAAYISSLCHHLLKQGYDPSQITVITPYIGQVFALRRAMPKATFDGVRITAIDNFQGEENDIILVSLVRSKKEDEDVPNKKNPIGFVGIENRICVSLSRAKMGMFVMGNFSLMAKHSELWKKMIDTMKQRSMLAPFVTLRCENHRDVSVKASQVSDFSLFPEGGCKRMCEFRLPCGHFCKRFCHLIDKEHKFYKCNEDCPKILCSYQHQCKRRCWQECGPCKEKVPKTIPVCNHVETIPCHQDPYKWKCKSVCEAELPCGHKCPNACSVCKDSGLHAISCQIMCERIWPCGHLVKSKCFQTANTFQCTKPCAAVLDCGHPCKGTCGECFEGRLHRQCKLKCAKTLPCGHRCNKWCSNVCPPCSKECGYTCSHGIKCKTKCSEDCKDCAELCSIYCVHGSCSRRCCENCDIEPCSEPCGRKFKCGHHCVGLCGEPCPPCRTCNKNAKFEQNIFDTEDKQDARFIQLQDCTCVVEVCGMDVWMMKKDRDDNQVKRCPKCKVPIKFSRRYSNIIKDQRRQIQKKNRKLYGDPIVVATKVTHLRKAINDLKPLEVQDDSSGLSDVLLRSLERPQLTLDYLEIVQQRQIFSESLLTLGYFVRQLLSPSSIGKKLRANVDKQIADVNAWLAKDRLNSSEQTWRELGLEIARLEYLAKFLYFKMENAKYYTLSADVEMVLEKVIDLLQDSQPLSLARNQTVYRVYQRIARSFRQSAVGVLTPTLHMVMKLQKTGVLPAFSEDGASVSMTTEESKDLSEGRNISPDTSV